MLSTHSLSLLLSFMATFLASSADPHVVSLADVSAPAQQALRTSFAQGVKPAPKAALKGSASRFIPTSDHRAVVKIARDLAPSPDMRDTLQEAFLQAIAGLREQARAAGVEDDFAGGVAVLIAARHLIVKSTELPDEAGKKVAWQLQALFDTAPVRGLTDTDRQAVHEWAICTALFLSAVAQAAQASGDPEQRKAAIALADKVVGDLFGIDARRISTDEAGLSIAEDRAEGTPVKATTPAPAAGVRRGVFPTLPGWTESRPGGTRTLTREFANEFGAKENYTLLVLAPRAREASLAGSFHRVWEEVVAPAYAKEQPTLPMVRRLRGGCACAFDNVIVKRKQDGLATRLGLFVVDDGSLVHPVVAIYNGFRESLEEEFVRFFDGFTGTGQADNLQLFEPSDLIGSWRAGANSFADFVDPATGNYRGDAGISWGETLVIAADGTYVSDFAATQGTRRLSVHEQGTWKLADDVLTFTPIKGGEDAKERTTRVYGLAPTTDTRGRALLLSNDGISPIRYTVGSSKPFVGDFYRYVP